jgi:transcription initiation factor TFIID subunit TAF12
MMQSVGEHKQVPKEEATVMLVGEQRKQCRAWKPAAQRRQNEGKDPGIFGSWKKVTVALRRMSYNARVAWQ